MIPSYYDSNCSNYWSYSPYSYSQNYETSSSTCSSLIESPTATSSPRSMLPIDPPCCYYSPGISYTPVVPRLSTHLPNRLQYTGRQRWLLNEIYQRVPYPNSVQKNVIADRVNATREQIRKCCTIASHLLDSFVHLGIWFQNRRRIAVQGHRSTSQRSPMLTMEQFYSVQMELEEILLDLDVHRNAPQRMPVGQDAASKRNRKQRK